MVTGGDRIKITDFGIVKLVGAEATDTSKIAYGSPRYVSPEQAWGEPLAQRSDIYSLGVILYEMLTGEPPFGGRSSEKEAWPRTEILRAHRERTPRPPSELNPVVTNAVERVVLRALEKKPERRFASAADFLRALRRARGRDGGGVSSEEQSEPNELKASRGTAIIVETTGELQGDTYHTQPIVSETCPACGVETAGTESLCRVCGQDLTASPATSELTRREINARQQRRGLKLVAVSALLLVLLASLVYLVRSRSNNSSAPPENVSTNANAGSQTTGSLAPTPRDTSPAIANVSALAAKVKTDSSFDGYNTKPLTDGVIDVRQIKAMRYNQGNWVSAESPEPHWVELDFKRPARVTAVYVYWGFDKDRYMPSRQLELQTPDEQGGWRTVSRLEPGENFDRAAFEFEPVVAERLRVFQPAQAAPPKRPFVMWVREVEAFGVPDGATPGERR